VLSISIYSSVLCEKVIDGERDVGLAMEGHSVVAVILYQYAKSFQ
jgi:hypothetical protein